MDSGYTMWGLGVFVKYLVDAIEASGQAQTPFLAEAIRSWRIAPIYDFWPGSGRVMEAAAEANFIDFTEQACAKLTTRELIPEKEIASWPSFGEEHLFPRGAKEVRAAPIIELGHAIIALLRGELPEPPERHWWFYGTPDRRSTIKMPDQPGEVYLLYWHKLY